MNKENLILAGDFNEKPEKVLKEFNSFGIFNSTQGQASRAGNTLDYIGSNSRIQQLICPDPGLSDHSPIMCNINTLTNKSDRNGQNVSSNK